MCMWRLIIDSQPIAKWTVNISTVKYILFKKLILIGNNNIERVILVKFLGIILYACAHDAGSASLVQETRN